MPTGYTAPVEDGKITDLSDFMLSCARGWGALVCLRDSDQSLEATRRYIETEAYLEGGDYYRTDLATSEARLVELKKMTDEQVLAAAQAEANAICRRNSELEAELEIKRERYEAMIMKVEAWQPPTADHFEFKDFMLIQLRDSLSYCTPFSVDPPEINLTWRTAQITRLRERIAFDNKEIEKQRERNDWRRAWILDLLASLEQPHAAHH